MDTYGIRRWAIGYMHLYIPVYFSGRLCISLTSFAIDSGMWLKTVAATWCHNLEACNANHGLDMAWLFRFTCWVWSVRLRGAACRHGPDALPVLGSKKLSSCLNVSKSWWMLLAPVKTSTYFGCTAAAHWPYISSSTMPSCAQAQLQAALHPGWRWCSQGRPAIGHGGEPSAGRVESPAHWASNWAWVENFGEWVNPKCSDSSWVFLKKCDEMVRPPFCWWVQLADVLLRSWSRSIMSVHWRGSQQLQKQNHGSKTQVALPSTQST